MGRRTEESPVWIGYADFLTTLTVLFFVIAVAFAGKLTHSKSGYVHGEVRAAAGGQGLPGCLIKLGQGRQVRSGTDGRFDFRVDSLRERLNIGIAAECEGYNEYSEIVAISLGDTTRVPITLAEAKVVRVDTLPGDALFGSSDFTLQPEAIEMLVELGRRLKSELASGDVVAVQGHTDDLPFQEGASKDNWLLSGERAAAAAKVLTDQGFGVGIPECQVAIMGFGPSRPVVPILPEDSRALRSTKRAKNRRIEFRMLHGTTIIGGHCSE
jgi:outer membrane protein OmpA-like peptidoglycan-associated protein